MILKTKICGVSDLETLTYIFDGGHHGSIFSNSLDLINGKKPYIEIFLQYGFLNTFVNSFFIFVFDQNILGLYFATTFFYSSSIILIALISKQLSTIYAFSFAILFCIFNHPIPEYPWPNYTAFFFLEFQLSSDLSTQLPFCLKKTPRAKRALRAKRAA